MAIILSNLKLLTIFFNEDCSKIVIKNSATPYIYCRYKFRESVGTYSRYGAVVINQIKKSLLLSPSLKKF